MKFLTGSLLGTAIALALFVPSHGAASQDTCSEGSSDERVNCLVRPGSELRLEMQRGVADLTIESQRLETKFDTDLRGAKRVIQESIAEQATRVDGVEIQLGTGLEEVKGEIQAAVEELRGGGTQNAIGVLAADVEKLKKDVGTLQNTAATALDTRGSVKEDLRTLQNAVTAARDVQVTLREDIESGVAGLTDNIEGILREIQEREADFTIAVGELNARLNELGPSRRAAGVHFGSGGNDDFGAGDTLTLDVTRNSVVFITAEARVPPRSTEAFVVAPQSALHQKCDMASVGPQVRRNVTVSCTFGGLESGIITISGGDPQGENSYHYFVLTPN